MTEGFALFIYLVVFTIAITFSIKNKKTVYKRDYKGRFSAAKKQIKWVSDFGK